MDKHNWHPADIIAGLRKKGTTLAAVSRASGLASSTLANALTRHWPKGERLIACALGKLPEEIWPSRYQGTSMNHGEGEADNTLVENRTLFRTHSPKAKNQPLGWFL